MQHKSDTIGINTKHNNSTRKQMSISNKYEIIERIGAGAYGEVFKAREVSTHKIVALKLIKRSVCTDGFPKTTIHEIILLRQFDHPNITKLIDVFTGNDRDVYLVFDYAEYDLSSLIRSRQLLTMQRIISFIRQMLLGLLVCHEKYIYHRDLKPDNILITAGNIVKISDFGLAKQFPQYYNKPKTCNVITVPYRPLELLLKSENYGPEVDIWSLGCVFFEMVVGRSPFVIGAEGPINETTIIKNIFEIYGLPDKEWPKWRDLQDANLYFNSKIKQPITLDSFLTQKLPKEFIGLKSLLSKMLCLNPEKRAKIEDLFLDPFLRSIDNVEPENIPKITIPEIHNSKEKNKK